MPRSIDAQLTALLPACESQSTLELALINGSIKRWITEDSGITQINGNSYTPHLQSSDELRQTIEAPSDRVAVSIQNIDTQLGKLAAADFRNYTLADAKIGRLFIHPRDHNNFQHRMIWRGKVTSIGIDQKEVKFELQPDYIALGKVVAARSLAPSCAWKFKSANCGYAGIESSCNKQLKSKQGCRGRDNTYRFGGFTFPEQPKAEPPGLGGGDIIGIGGGIDPTCFLAGTPIATPEGPQPIESLKVGGRVNCFDERRGRFTESFISEAFAHDAKFYFEIGIDDGILKVTPEHLFYTTSGWRPADQLSIGTELVSADWDTQFVKSIKTRLEPARVYNIEVADHHTYLANGVVVHNLKYPGDIYIGGIYY